METQTVHNFGRDIAWRLTQFLAQWHGDVGLVVAECGVFRRSNHAKQFVWRIHHGLEGTGKAGLYFGESVHEVWIFADESE